MHLSLSTLLVTGVFFVLIFASGFWLGRARRPYPGLRFNLHKLLGVGAAVYLAVTVVRAAPLTSIQLGAALASAALFVADVVAGGLASLERPMPAVLGLAHKLLPYLVLAATGGMLVLLRRGVSRAAPRSFPSRINDRAGRDSPARFLSHLPRFPIQWEAGSWGGLHLPAPICPTT